LGATSQIDTSITLIAKYVVVLSRALVFEVSSKSAICMRMYYNYV
jgi:hypothetical protein